MQSSLLHPASVPKIGPGLISRQPQPSYKLKSFPQLANPASPQRTTGSTEQPLSVTKPSSVLLCPCQAGGIRPGMGPGGEQAWGCFQNICPHPATMARTGKEGNLSQVIYLFMVFKAASCGFSCRSSAGGLLRVDCDTQTASL